MKATFVGQVFVSRTSLLDIERVEGRPVRKEVRLSEKPDFSITARPSPPQIFLDEFDHVAEEDITEA